MSYPPSPARRFTHTHVRYNTDLSAYSALSPCYLNCRDSRGEFIEPAAPPRYAPRQSAPGSAQRNQRYTREQTGMRKRPQDHERTVTTLPITDSSLWQLSMRMGRHCWQGPLLGSNLTPSSCCRCNIHALLHCYPSILCPLTLY
jgi:hypothetical protein